MTEDTRKLAALMITDMVGYTRLSQRDEARALRLLQEHNVLIRESVDAHGGREVKHTGDGFLIEFPSALQSVSCSIDIQRQLRDRNEKADEVDQFSIRIGLHVGDVVHRDGDVFGDGVNITSRIEPLALPGGICLSQSVQAQVWNKIDRPLENLGPKDLKNVQLPMEIFRVVLPWESKAKNVVKERAKKLDRTRLAVLPLVNISQDPSDAYFADGMTEELIYTLSRAKGIRVIAQTSAMAYKGTNKTIREIGHELDVGSILEGSVRKSGDRVRITTQLIDVQTEEHLWAERYDRELADVFEIQSEISAEVGKGLKTLLKNHNVPKAVNRPTEQLDAYTEYLKGRHCWNRRTQAGVTEALEHFQRALDVDPKFARAYSGIADCYSVLANHGYERNDVALPLAKDAAKKALELDPNLAEAHASLGLAYMQFKGNLEAAERELSEAIRLNPSYATARQWYSGVLHSQLRLDDALEHAQLAIGLDPLAHIMHINAASILMNLKRLEDAREHFMRAIELEPSYEGTYADLSRVEMSLWNWVGAKKALSEALKRQPNNVEALTAKSYLYFILGKKDAALEAAETALAMAPDASITRDHWGQTLRLVRRPDEARQVFESLLADGDPKPWTPLFLCLAYLDEGRASDALALLGRSDIAEKLSKPGMVIWSDMLTGMAAAIQEDEPTARACVERISAVSDLPEIHSAQASILLLFGDLDAAAEQIEQAMAQHEQLLLNITMDPLFCSYHSDPRFRQMLEVMGLAQVAEPV